MKMTDEIRNAFIPLGIRKANTTKKYIIVSVISILIALFFKSITVNYIQSLIFDFIMVSSIIGIVSLTYEKLYIRYQEKLCANGKYGVVITHSNKVYFVQEDNIISETDCDEIKIRPVDDTKEDAYKRLSSVVECIKDNKTVVAYAICKLKEFENTTLLPNLDRVDEDVHVIYD